VPNEVHELLSLRYLPSGAAEFAAAHQRREYRRAVILRLWVRMVRFSANARVAAEEVELHVPKHAEQGNGAEEHRIPAHHAVPLAGTLLLEYVANQFRRRVPDPRALGWQTL